MGIYVTPGELRAELEVDEQALPDGTAERRIRDAERALDRMLVTRSIDPDTGRKVVQADVEPWQWDLVKQATLVLAIEEQGEVDRQAAGEMPPRFRQASGPDFSYSDPLPSSAPSGAMALLRDAKLMSAWAGASGPHQSGRPFPPAPIG